MGDGDRITVRFTRSEMGPSVPVTTIGERGEKRTTLYNRWRTWEGDTLLEDKWVGGFVEMVEEPESLTMRPTLREAPYFIGIGILIGGLLYLSHWIWGWPG